MDTSNATRVPVGKAVLFSGGRPRACIVLADDSHAAEREAAMELARYLECITGSRFPCVVGAPCGGLWPIAVGTSGLAAEIMERASLSVADRGEEAFAVGFTRDGIVLQGGRARSTLYAVYDFLEMLGCRFLEPGVDGEDIPRTDHLQLDPINRVEEPALPHRDVNEP